MRLKTTDILAVITIVAVITLVLWSRVEFCSAAYPMVNPLVCAVGMGR